MAGLIAVEGFNLDVDAMIAGVDAGADVDAGAGTDVGTDSEAEPIEGGNDDDDDDDDSKTMFSMILSFYKNKV